MPLKVLDWGQGWDSAFEAPRYFKCSSVSEPLVESPKLFLWTQLVLSPSLQPCLWGSLAAFLCKQNSSRHTVCPFQRVRRSSCLSPLSGLSPGSCSLHKLVLDPGFKCTCPKRQMKPGQGSPTWVPHDIPQKDRVHRQIMTKGSHPQGLNGIKRVPFPQGVSGC